MTEISPAHLRGRLGSLNMLAVTTGMILAFCAGYLFSYGWLSLLGCIPPALVLFLMLWMPESPRWYLEKKRKSDALRSLLWLRGTQFGLQEESCAIEASLGNLINKGRGG